MDKSTWLLKINFVNENFVPVITKITIVQILADIYLMDTFVETTNIFGYMWTIKDEQMSTHLVSHATGYGL